MSNGSTVACARFLFAAAILLLSIEASGQVRKFDEATNAQTEKTTQQVLQPAGVPLESTIDPALYYVGPSDGIAVNIWMSPPVNATLTVTPEGTLIIPTVGEVKVSDLTLQEAKKKVLTEIQKRYRSTDATVTLVVPRQIVVTVTGNVLVPGSYVVRATDRANAAIQEADKADPLLSDSAKAVRKTMSTRNIALKRKDGTMFRVDLVKYFATKDDRLNPYLREGDVVFVPPINPEKNVIGVYGEVNSPGRYEYVDGDDITDAIRIAYGFTRFAIPDSVELSKLDASASVLSTRIVSVRDIMDGKSADIRLEVGDRVFARGRTDLRKDYRVTITGEVVAPGTYPITKDKTLLSGIIARAGGFTEYAALQSAELIRRSISPQSAELERLMSLRGSVSADDSAYYNAETSLRLRREMVNIDFEKLFAKRDSTQDVILQSEDEIVVPSITRTVYVFGGVVSPGHVTFVSGENAEYYIRRAGGYADRARSGDVRIIKARTKQWVAPGDTKIEEGDDVWVPKNVDHPFSYYMTVTSQAATVFSVVIGIAVVIIQLRK